MSESKLGNPIHASDLSSASSTQSDGPYISACRGRRPERLPVWLMRQAGRSLPEYRAVRGSGSILDALKNPELSAEITMQPVRRHSVDAAILYSDIVVPAHAIGFGVEIAPGIGPVIEHPFRSAADLERLRPLEPEADTPWVLDTLDILTAELDVPIIGFCGAPFTVASYLIEGRPSRNYINTMALMRGDETLWRHLMERLADIALESMRSQVAHGAAALQIFDSWIGALAPSDYRTYIAPTMAELVSSTAELGIPVTIFGTNTGELLDELALPGISVVGVDWRTPLSRAAQRVPGRTLQGNLDPTVLLSGIEVARREALRIATEGTAAPAHIFNLGHGVLPETDPGVITELVDYVHSLTPQDLGGS